MKKPWIILSVAGALGLTAAGWVLAGSALASEVKGTVDTVSGSRLVVGGKVTRIDGNTDIQGQLVAGSRVEIKTRKSDGALVAVRVEVEGTGNDRDNQGSDEGQEGSGHSANYTELHGVVSELSGNTFVAGGKHVTTNSATRTEGALANGVGVEVQGVVQPDGTLLAVKIEAERGVGEAQGQTQENRESEGDEREGDESEHGTPSARVTQPTPPAANATPVSFTATIQPILNQNCVTCHSGQGVNLSSYATVKNFVLKGNPASSVLYKAVASGRMPPGGSLSQAQMQAIADWIYQGAQNN